MEKVTKIFLILTLAVFLCYGSALAAGFGTNITIPDQTSSGTGWYGAQEDQEVEPGCVTGQQWDLEAFMLKGSILTMVGGYDFKNGEYGNGMLFRSGDIFIDTNNANAGYEYVLDLDFGNEKYDIYAINSSSTLLPVFYSQNSLSNPWRYSSGGTQVGTTGSMVYQTGLSDSDTGLLGGSHNAVSVDLSFLNGILNPGDEFITHFTMECGNDNLMGKSTIPEPATMVLLGTGLIGLALFSRRRIINK